MKRMLIRQESGQYSPQLTLFVQPTRGSQMLNPQINEMCLTNGIQPHCQAKISCICVQLQNIVLMDEMCELTVYLGMTR